MKRLSYLLAAACTAAALIPLAAGTSTAAAPHSAPSKAAHATAAPAAASACTSDYFCFFYNSNEGGSHDALRSNVSNLAGYKFTSTGAGQGQSVKNNAASAVNNNECTATVYYNSNYGGDYDVYGYKDYGQLIDTYNENASLGFATFCG